MSTRLPTTDRAARVALSRIAEPGNTGVHRAVQAHGAVDALTRFVNGAMSATGVVGGHYSWSRLAEDLRGSDLLGARVVVPSDADWPAGLNDLTVPPLCLWVRGEIDLAAASARSVAVVGARSATAYGTHVATDLAVGMCERGFAVVSGAAFGIDAAAHRGALAVDGLTVAVLAGGIDRLYPASHAQLLGTIADEGAVISEQPLGVAPIGSRFLKRNRIIAALTNGTVVVEASLRSGSLNTAGHATSLGRPVAAVPGPVTSMQSAGCHALLREIDSQVQLVSDADELAEHVGRIGYDLAEPKRGERRATDDLDPEDRLLYEALPLRAHRQIPDLARSVGLTEIAVRAGLGRLELCGAAERDLLDGWRKTGTTSTRRRSTRGSVGEAGR